MIAAEAGFLLLGSQLGNPQRRPLTPAQWQTLAHRVEGRPSGPDRELERHDLTALGYGAEEADHLLELLSEEALLEACLQRGLDADCYPLTPASPLYPQILRQKLGWKAPACLWAKGNPVLLERPKAALVGSRALAPENAHFARAAGREAARQGYVLVSGNARGADQTAQRAALEAGGAVISVVADALTDHMPGERELFLSENCFDLPFSPIRALSRNPIIHILGEKTFVAQVTPRQGGTWDGTTKNLRQLWSPVFCFRDGSEGSLLLAQLGAQLIAAEELSDFHRLCPLQESFF